MAFSDDIHRKNVNWSELAYNYVQKHVLLLAVLILLSSTIKDLVSCLTVWSKCNLFS